MEGINMRKTKKNSNNFSCDCNRSLAIRWEYGEDAIPELDCGDEIEMIDYHIEYED